MAPLLLESIDLMSSTVLSEMNTSDATSFDTLTLESKSVNRQMLLFLDLGSLSSYTAGFGSWMSVGQKDRC